jgi:hypothetical protein
VIRQSICTGIMPNRYQDYSNKAIIIEGKKIDDIIDLISLC